MLLGSLQEDVLVLVIFDNERAPIIRGVVDLSLYGGPYRIIASRAYDYIDRFKRAPGIHLPNLLSDKLEGNNPREAALYTEILDSLNAAQTSVNPPYILSQIETFIKRQSLRSIAIDLAKALQRDTEASLEEAEHLLASANRSTLSVFDPGIRLSDKKRALGFLDISNTALPTGIPELDRRGFGPVRGELWLLIANSSAGKSWGLTQLAKMALMTRARVLHITLEMSADRCAQRYFQTLFAISKRKEVFQSIKFKRDDLGRIEGLEGVQITPKLGFDDPNIRQKLEAKIDKWSQRLLDNIYIKQFPTGNLTINQLKAYLDNLEATEHFLPDLLIVDYPDLFRLDKDNFRLALDEVFKDLRGIAVARNIAVAAVSQSHRGAAKAKQVGMDNVAEAYSKIAHSDVVLTYSQTGAEKKLGLARLYVAKGRNDSDKFVIVISQQYGIGNFVMDSNIMSGGYWSQLPQEE